MVKRKWKDIHDIHEIYGAMVWFEIHSRIILWGVTRLQRNNHCTSPWLPPTAWPPGFVLAGRLAGLGHANALLRRPVYLNLVLLLLRELCCLIHLASLVFIYCLFGIQFIWCVIHYTLVWSLVAHAWSSPGHSWLIVYVAGESLLHLDIPTSRQLIL